MTRKQRPRTDRRDVQSKNGVSAASSSTHTRDSETRNKTSARASEVVVSRLTKWAVFGVVLSVLPVFAKLLGALIQGRGAVPGFDDLFSDGELLVVATVIAAAGIGDVIFEGSSGDRALRSSLAMTGALLVVIASVLLYGFASLQEEYRKSASDYVTRQTAERNDALGGQAQEIARAVETAKNDVDAAEKALNDELTGQGGTGVPGAGPELERRRQELDLAQARLASAQSQQKTVTDAVINSSIASVSPISANQGKHETAIASVVLFPISIIAGGLCVLVVGHESTMRRKRASVSKSK